MEMFDPRVPNALDHGGTFTASPIVMRAGLAALQLLTTSEIDRINQLGDMLRARLLGLGYTVNGRGSLSRVVSHDPTALWWELYRAGTTCWAQRSDMHFHRHDGRDHRRRRQTLPKRATGEVSVRCGPAGGAPVRRINGGTPCSNSTDPPARREDLPIRSSWSPELTPLRPVCLNSSRAHAIYLLLMRNSYARHSPKPKLCSRGISQWDSAMPRSSGTHLSMLPSCAGSTLLVSAWRECSSQKSSRATSSLRIAAAYTNRPWPSTQRC